MRRLLVLVLFSLVGLAACSTTYRVVQPPLRDADLYPRSQTKAGITIAVDEITDPERVKMYCGVDLTRADILPINVVVSNHGNGRCMIKPSDVLLLHGKDVIDPVPVERVAEIIEDDHGYMSPKNAQQVDDFFAGLALQETVLTPQDSCQGILFFKTAPRDNRWDRTDERIFTIVKLFREGSLKVRVTVTDMESGERIHFGPFSLSGL